MCINSYTPNEWPSKSMKQNLIELKGERESSTIIVGEFNTPVSIMVGHTDRR